jgi:hypothetical protein
MQRGHLKNDFHSESDYSMLTAEIVICYKDRGKALIEFLGRKAVEIFIGIMLFNSFRYIIGCARIKTLKPWGINYVNEKGHKKSDS